ncbi:UDP-N-acetylmuramoyl-tripeptide--D-alanyl-D-alanine ligase [Endozoicomonas arenosclerae]|uniref:UDP-N-acetylmuramoyl-tripeptide--D-alanyl-D- alanine ligase n=1 Tax=Endozoicomonas arenosclerae TaxID=1633495 RepID=UPI0007848FBF|nr:UDP-N-acetylmuramoyl-tripeptide--D-alanyl-D-alanine ligase [Endozoicomonas arenosclerae]
MIRSYALSELAEVLKGSLTGIDATISGISIDTRTLARGDLFIAIKGPKFDGHAYVTQAQAAGASAVVVQQPVEVGIPQILVEDTTQALGRLGQFNREGFSAPVLAVTGTCGKTSVKEMLAAVLEETGDTLATLGNLNNAFGVPLTLFRLEGHQKHAVVELGTSSPGEIDYITRLTEPDVSIITNAAENHLKDLHSLEGVIHEKGFILEGLKKDGAAVLSLDDPSFQRWKNRAMAESSRSVLSFSLDKPQANAFASEILSTLEGMTFNLHIRREDVEQKSRVRLAFWGKHQVQNACCAAAAALAVGLELDIIVRGLENARPYQRRGTRYPLSDDVLVIDESYNASPIATLAAIDQLADCEGETILALGDMLDLGDVSEARHIDVGEYANTRGISCFAAYGDASVAAIKAYGSGSGQHFNDKEALSNWVRSKIKAFRAENTDRPVTVLVKGSRGMEMLDVVRSLVGSEYKGER